MRDRIPFKGRESRDAQAAAQKRAAQNERVSRAADSIKAAFEKKRTGGDVTDEIYGGGTPDEGGGKPKAG
jgi:hypothetical protein